MAQKPETDKPRRVWLFTYSTTALVLLGVLVPAGLIYWYENRQQEELDPAEELRASAEREAQEEEQAASRKEARDLERARQTVRDRIRRTGQRAEMERAAREKEALELRDSDAEERRKRAIEARATRFEHDAALDQAQALKNAEAQQRAAAEKEAARKQHLADLQFQYRLTVPELKDLRGQLEEIEDKLATNKHYMDGWSKLSEAFQQRKDELDALVAQGPGGKDLDMAMAKYKADIERAASRYKESEIAYYDAEEARKQLAPKVRRLQQRRDVDIMELAAMGVEATMSDHPRPVQKKVLTLKGGRRIVSIWAVEAGDEWLVKGEDGKTETIPAAQVEKVETQEIAPSGDRAK